jgi:hypothetical protein
MLIEKLPPITVRDSGGNACHVGVPAIVSGYARADRFTLACDAGDWF